MNKSVDSCETLSELNKPISDNPKFNDTLKEELRSRLLFVKSALQKSQPDYEHQRIQDAFTNKTLKVFTNMVKISPSLDLDQLRKILLDRLREDKDEAHCETLEKYSNYFEVEFTHFLRMHGFVKLPQPVAPLSI